MTNFSMGQIEDIGKKVTQTTISVLIRAENILEKGEMLEPKYVFKSFSSTGSLKLGILWYRVISVTD